MPGTRELIATTRRERVINWGTCVEVVGAQERGICDIDLEQSSDLIVTVQCKALLNPEQLVGDFRPYVRIDYGQGATDVTIEVDCTRRQRIPTPGGKARVVGFVKSMPIAVGNGTAVQTLPVPSSVTAQIAAFVAEHTDAEPLAPTYWIDQMGVGQGNLVGPFGLVPAAIQQVQPGTPGQMVRLVTLRAFVSAGVSGGELVFFQLFDEGTVPAPGDTPVDVWPLIGPGASIPPDNFRFTRSFTQGLAWGISSTPFAFTPIEDAAAFVTVELLH